MGGIEDPASAKEGVGVDKAALWEEKVEDTMMHQQSKAEV